MKKIFVSIIALAALVGCNISSVEDVNTALTAPMEVGFNDETRLFDQNLNWSWENNDQIAAFQYAGSMTINTLSLKDNGKFGTDSFVYATEAPSTFLFVYPSEALNRTDYTLGFVQTGVWTPVLVGTAQNATVDAIPVVSMEHKSAAFEIRVWDEGRAARKSIKSATITSTQDFLNGGNTASVNGINSDTVVFNLAEGDFGFELTLVATDDETYTVTVPTKNFALGKRTVLNVEWKYPFVEPKLSYNILSSYTNKDNSLDGRSIYVNNIVLTDADSATIALYLNGNKVANMTPGQTTTVSNLTPGEYKAQVKWSAKGRDYTSEETTVYVTGIPYAINPAANDSWNEWSKEGNLDWNQSGALFIGGVGRWVGSFGDEYIEKKFYVPADTNVAINVAGTVCGSGSVMKVNTTFTVSVSGTAVYSVSSTSGNKTQSYSGSNITATFTASNPVIRCNSSYNAEQACASISSLKILYR